MRGFAATNYKVVDNFVADSFGSGCQLLRQNSSEKRTLNELEHPNKSFFLVKLSSEYVAKAK